MRLATLQTDSMFVAILAWVFANAQIPVLANLLYPFVARIF
jgi:hypothetical protein